MKLDDTPSWNEVRKLVNAVIRKYKKGDIDLQHCVFYLFVFTSGMRISEILSLRKRDFINAEFVRFEQKKKRKKYVREVVVPPVVRPYLTKLLQELREDERLFPWTRQNGWKLVKKFTERVLGRRIRPHAFRHAVALRMLLKTKDVELVKRQLGHARIDTTMIYLNYTLRDRKEEVEAALALE